MRAVVLLPNQNHVRNDYGGAFRPEAQAFARLHTVPPHAVYQIDISRDYAQRRAQSLECIRSARARYGAPIECVALFCHGWKNGVQIGWLRAHAREVARVLAETCARDVRVPLYCCLTGASIVRGAIGGDGGFADTLRDELCKAGVVDCVVDAHDRKGHTTRNPYVVRFRGQGSPTGGQGGAWIVAPKTDLFRVWDHKIETTDLRFRFPFLSTAQIHAEVLGLPAVA